MSSSDVMLCGTLKKQIKVDHSIPGGSKYMHT